MMSDAVIDICTPKEEEGRNSQQVDDAEVYFYKGENKYGEKAQESIPFLFFIEIKDEKIKKEQEKENAAGMTIGVVKAGGKDIKEHSACKRKRWG